MKKQTIVTMCMMTLALALGSCSTGNYRYACVSLETIPGKVLAEGNGNPRPCKAMFERPLELYVGPAIEIPKAATVYGVLVITHGRRIGAIPLHKWTTEKGEAQFGCNGPTPQFAHQGKTQEEFLASLKHFLGK
jgi:hypothetical protein